MPLASGKASYKFHEAGNFRSLDGLKTLAFRFAAVDRDRLSRCGKHREFGV